MICGVLASASAPTQALSSPFSKPRSSSFLSASSSSSGKVHTDLKLKSDGFYGRKGSQRSIFHCSSSAGPGGPGFGIVLTSVSSNFKFFFLYVISVLAVEMNVVVETVDIYELGFSLN